MVEDMGLKLTAMRPPEWHHLCTKYNEDLPSGSVFISGGHTDRQTDKQTQTGELTRLFSFLESRLKKSVTMWLLAHSVNCFVVTCMDWSPQPQKTFEQFFPEQVEHIRVSAFHVLTVSRVLLFVTTILSLYPLYVTRKQKVNVTYVNSLTRVPRLSLRTRDNPNIKIGYSMINVGNTRIT
jgi:hypothetical protein